MPFLFEDGLEREYKFSTDSVRVRILFNCR
jgi:hypothetical protein